MYHSVYFGEKNTWDDWHLVPTKRPVIQPPKVKERRVTIPGRIGALDLTDTITGTPRYQNREGSISFYIMHEYEDSYDLISKITKYLNGKFTTMVLEDDPGFFYRGYFWVEETSPDEKYSQLTIAYNVEPFKWSIHSFEDDQWKWDPFNFETDSIKEKLKDIPLAEGRTEVNLSPAQTGQIQETYPVLTLETTAGNGVSCLLSIGGSSDETLLSFKEGDNIIKQVLRNGAVFKFDLKTGTGKVSLKFRKGML